jgi:hypothetical protein
MDIEEAKLQLDLAHDDEVKLAAWARRFARQALEELEEGEAAYDDGFD